jgi:hypothetical protein
MSRATAAIPAENPLPRLSPFDSIFIRTVLDHRGIGGQPSLGEFTAALNTLRKFYEQSLDNPRDGAWQPSADDETMAALRAKAFMMFGATKPSPAQWQKAHVALFGPLLCETCG